MATIYDRIKLLCAKKEITIAKLEVELGIANGSIKRWGVKSYPSADKIVKVASYFNVSTDYILVHSDVEGSISEILGDEDIISFQRAKEIIPERYKIAKEIIQTGFDAAFSAESEDDNS